MIKAEMTSQNHTIYYCRICGYSGGPDEVFSRPLAFRCRNCGTVQAAELPSIEQLKDYYGKKYLDQYTAGMNPHRFKVEMPKRHAAKLAYIKRYKTTGTLLDAGCGEGFFLQLALNAGFDAIGCDYDFRTDYPERVSVKLGTLDSKNGLPFRDGMFDIVTCWAVIEHVRDPVTALQEILRVLNKDGYLFLDTPLCGDFCERLVAARSHWLHPPEHLHVFTAKSLRLVIEKTGFKLLDHRVSYERNLVRWSARRLRNILVGTLLGGGLKLLAPVKWEFMRSNRVTQIGDIQLCVAQKP